MWIYSKLKNLLSDLPSLILLMICLLLTAGLYAFSYHSTKRKLEERLNVISERFVSNIKTRIARYENVLIQARAHIITSDHVSREDFKKYVESISLLQRFPGMQGLGYSVKVSAQDLKNYERQVRSEGFPDFKVWPVFPREEYFSIHFLEPFDWRNQRAFGYDMSTSDERRTAMSVARDSGSASMTSKIKLVQETNKGSQPGFLIYLPVYKNNVFPETLEERRQQLVGFVYAPFRSKDLFKTILEQDLSVADEVYAEIFSGSPSAEHLYYNFDEYYGKKISRPFHHRVVEQKIEVLGQAWIFRGRLRLSPELQIEEYIPVMLALILTLLSFLIYWIAYSTRFHHRQLQAAVKTRDEFMSLASHELQTPLTSLLIRTQMLQKRLMKGDIEKEKISDFMSFTQGQVKRLTKLVDNLLDVSRISSGKFKLQKEPFNFGQMVRDVIDRTLPIFNREGTPIPQLIISEEISGEWDLLRIEQVITNLLTNANRYGEGKPVLVTLNRKESDLIFSIQDNGRGIDAAHLEKIFERFERLVNPNEISGLGLGLYLSRKIIEAHGGKIWAESRVGEGSTFYIQLPVS